MIIAGHSGVYSINQLTETEINIILSIVEHVNSRCFEEQDEDGEWYSNEDFVMHLSDEERTALSKLGAEIKMMF